MPTQQKFSCFIIGEGTLPVQCAEILWQRQHDIYGIISSDPLLKRWASDRGILYLEPTDDLLVIVRQQPFDYLFSIVNPHVLPAEMLALPRQKAINYHDAPLPKYAGVHATSWAIIQQEPIHGVTWHVMTEQVDAGDILKQYIFDLVPDDTALTLNAKCYDAAIRLFAELVEELAHRRVLAQPQNLPERTYFPLYQRPPAGCLISWQQSAQQISAFVRALDFGPYPNELGLPKLTIGNEFIVVTKLEVLAAPSAAPPGTIAGITEDSLRISTTTQQVALRKLLTIDGQPLPIPEAIARFGLSVGYKFETPTQALAERLTTSNGRICRHETFWVKRLAELQPITLPYKATDTLWRKDSQVSPVSTLSAPIPAEVVTFVKKHPTWRLADFLSATFAAYLARISGLDCFDIGFSPDELSRDLAGLAGFFAARVPLRVELDETWSFEQLYEVVRQQVELAKQHGTYARDILARYPELGAMAESAGRQAWPVSVDQTRNLDDYQPLPGSELTLVVANEGSSPAYHCFYDSSIFDEVGVATMLHQFTTLLRGLVAAKVEQPLWTLPLLTAAEQQQLLVEWNNTDTVYPREQCIHQLFEAQAAQTPEAIAVIYEGEELTYRELNRQVNQLAHFLRAQGIGPEVGVGICVERSLEMVVGILGILKAGGFYLPLDPAYPKERLAFMLEDAQVPVLLTQQQLVAQFPKHKGQVICLDSDWPVIAQESKTNPTSGVTANNLAYVIYTSGSTGRPKGVLIPHQALVNHNVAMAQLYDLRPNERVLQFASISFDVAAEELFPSWLSGATVVLQPKQMWSSFTEFLQFLEKEQLTVLNLPTPYWYEWVSELSRSKVPLPPQLRLVIVGSEKVLSEQLTCWQELVGNRIQWLNGYGPTEATITATIYQPGILSGKREGYTVPIGRPIANTRIYLLDQHLNPMPIGLPGELYIGGAGLARGYLHQPELTAEKFIPNPFSNDPEARLYKTGDLARYLPDGNLEFLGRFDQQVKIRGFRVELGEIEAILSQHPAVRQGIVVVREDIPGDKRLVAYIVLKQEPAPAVGEWRRFLKEQLPDYMVPSAFVILAALPLTPNGKVDRRALPLPDPTRPEVEGYTPPRNPTEEAIAAIWAEILGLAQVGIHDNFFELGGHSLIAVRLLAKIKKTFSVDLSLATLFEVPTIAQFAELLQDELGQTISQTQPNRKKRRKDWSPLVAIQPKGSKPPFFCIHGIHGNVLVFSYLARYLGSEQPFYGLQAQGADGKRPGHRRLEDMAALYIEEIRSIQPEGPYHLGGFSMGGEIAFEMAQQLSAQGQEVALLALLDTEDPGQARLRSRQFVHDSGGHDEVNANGHLPGAKNNNRIRKFLSRSPKEKVHSLARWTDGRAKFIQYKIAQFSLSTGRTLSQSLTEHYLEGIHSEALLGYTPKPYPGRITLFRAVATLPDEAADPAMRWSALAQGGLELHLLDSPHEILDEPYVQVLAQKLKACLNNGTWAGSQITPPLITD